MQRAQQARLADPGIARDQDHLAVAVLGPSPPFQQDGELVLAPDQRRQTLPTQRLEAAIGATLAVDPERRERLCEAFEREAGQGR